MKRVVAYSLFLLAGMAASQFLDLNPWKNALQVITQVCLGYIMIEAGLEFSADMRHPKTYTGDAAIAVSAAVVPWFLTALYFVVAMNEPWAAAALVACFAAPTSAGVLFTLLAAAGLSRTWIFKKARVLAIFDDLATLLLLIPLQMILTGWKPTLFINILLAITLVYIGFRWANRSAWPVTKPWLIVYAMALVAIRYAMDAWLGLHIEVLLPAFVAGCILRHRGIEEGDDPHSLLDQSLKVVFLFLVGCALPAVRWAEASWAMIGLHVLALTVLGNLGKCVPFLFYKDEASPRERLGLSIAMFPRGEVGAGVLLLALHDGVGGLPVLVGSLSLALNLIGTGFFILAVRRISSTAPRS